jgi:hypothetical protein
MKQFLEAFTWGLLIWTIFLIGTYLQLIYLY